jgi:molybdenum cofactor biosynthesis enzyme
VYRYQADWLTSLIALDSYVSIAMQTKVRLAALTEVKVGHHSIWGMDELVDWVR